jgi:hypothetical protein
MTTISANGSHVNANLARRCTTTVELQSIARSLRPQVEGTITERG